MSLRPFLMALGLALAYPVFAQDAVPLPAQGDQSTDNEMQATEGDALVLALLIAMDDHAIRTADIARRKLLSQPVTDYAKLLFDDHTAHHARSDEIRRGILAEAVEPAELKAVAQAREQMREQLDDLDGEQFETAYLDAMVKERNDAIGMIDRRLLAAAKNDDVVAHLRMTRGLLASHLERARFLVENPDR